MPDEQLANEYDDLAYRAIANPDLSDGLANSIARIAKNTAKSLRGGKREGAGRPTIDHQRRERLVLYTTPDERKQLLSLLKSLRTPSE